MTERKEVQRLFGTIVKEERNTLGLTQFELAEKSNLDSTYISQIERGLANPSIYTVLKIANSLNLEESEIFGRINNYSEFIDATDTKREEELEIIYNAITKLNASLLLTTTHDDDYRVIFCNDTFLKFIQSDKKAIIGRKLMEILSDGKNNEKLMDFLIHLKDDSSKSGFITRVNQDGENVQFEINASPIYNGREQVEQHFFLLKKKQLELKAKPKIEETVQKYKTLLDEANHRIKNNLSIIVGIIDVNIFETADESVKSVLQDTQLRISSIAHIHELLIEKEDKSKLGIKDYLDKLTTVIANMYNSQKEINIEVSVEVDEFEINQIITLGLLSNELITNSYKYAFPNKKEGNIWLSLKHSDDKHISFSYRDDGIGFDKKKFKELNSLGFSLTRTFLDQLNAKNIDIKTENGFKLEFDLEEQV